MVRTVECGRVNIQPNLLGIVPFYFCCPNLIINYVPFNLKSVPWIKKLYDQPKSSMLKSYPWSSYKQVKNKWRSPGSFVSLHLLPWIVEKHRMFSKGTGLQRIDMDFSTSCFSDSAISNHPGNSAWAPVKVFGIKELTLLLLMQEQHVLHWIIKSNQRWKESQNASWARFLL